MPLDEAELNYYENLIEVIDDNVRMLQVELIAYSENEIISKAIRKQIRIRQGQLRYYVGLLEEYKKLD